MSLREWTAVAVAGLTLAIPKPSIAQDRVHLVRQGDTLPRLVFLYGVDASAIQRANHLSGSTLTPGKRLVIPSGEPRPVRAAEPVEERRAEPVQVATPEPMQLARAESEPAPMRAAPVVPFAAPEPTHRTDSSFSDAISRPASENIRYNGRWTPPGESSAWVMDCSNTARWLHKEVNGIELPRTASDQYEWLRARRKLWKARPDSRSLAKKLEPGDLLFWENTYKPVRKPPITHVMVYLGRDSSGRMMMAGSQGSSGPDVYPFKPEQKMGGYRFFLFFHKDGRFVAYGRP